MAAAAVERDISPHLYLSTYSPTTKSEEEGGSGEQEKLLQPLSVSVVPEKRDQNPDAIKPKKQNTDMPTQNYYTLYWYILVLACAVLVVIIKGITPSYLTLSEESLFAPEANISPHYWNEQLRDHAGCDISMAHGKWSFWGSPPSWITQDCYSHSYKPADLKSCLMPRRPQLETIHGAALVVPTRRFIFYGDSNAREMYVAFAAFVGITASVGDKNSDLSVIKKWDAFELSLEFYFDPKMEAIQENAEKVARRIFAAENVDFLVLNVGSWFLKMGSSEQKLLFASRFQTVIREFQPWTHFNTDSEQPLTAFRYVGPFVAEKLNTSRKNLTNALEGSNYNFFIMDSASHRVPHEYQKKSAALLSSYMLLKSAPQSGTEDGLHFAPFVMQQEVNLILNRLCNQRLSVGDSIISTCCVEKSWLSVPISTILFLGLLFFLGPVSLGIYAFGERRFLKFKEYLPTARHCLVLSQLLFLIVAMYLADRTFFFAKQNKDFSWMSFCAPLFFALILGLMTLKQGKDDSFLNRDQTNEWKGWMQIIILVYHWTGASKVSEIYNFIRVLVAAYLFMTGYGHFSYFYAKNDFGLPRVVSSLARLNFLSVAMAYTMNKSIVFYYFGPLVSFWFLVVYWTMMIGSDRNKDPKFLLPKIAASAIIVTLFLHSGILELVFSALRLLAIDWDAKEALFRINLDGLVVYSGMLISYAVINLKGVDSSPLIAKWKHMAAIAGGIAIAAYVLVEAKMNKLVYNEYHFIISIFPILGFITLRNLTPMLRRTHSTFWAWIGGFSLETFLLQYHMWLAMDTKGLLTFIPGLPEANFVIGSVLFLALSEWAGGPLSTGCVEWLAGNGKEGGIPYTRLALTLGSLLAIHAISVFIHLF